MSEVILRGLTASMLLSATLLACGDNATIQETPGPDEFFDEEHSAARNWNEVLLEAIRTDLARPTVHARNLFHSSALMYDLWAAYDETAEPYFLGNTVSGTTCEFSDAQRSSLRSSATSIEESRSAAISYAMRSFLRHRFRDTPNTDLQLRMFDTLFVEMGYSTGFDSRDFEAGNALQNAAALGLYLADCVIEFGASDGANEDNNYANKDYAPVNPPLEPDKSGNPEIIDPDRWQPLELRESIDQAGNVIENEPAFIGAEWGRVTPFAIPEGACDVRERDGLEWTLCHDPGPPALLSGGSALPAEYLWNHSVVAYWSSHLDPNDGVFLDISPSSIGNSGAFPGDIPSLQSYYDAFEGGVTDSGHALNPTTGLPYPPNVVPRGDYTRVLAEFWADGPDSETPPGHWFTIVNDAVSDHPDAPKQYRGMGPRLDDLEWDVKVYFALGGALHDAAISAWGAKGWYDYIRPISAIRYMAAQGQSTDNGLSNYDPNGLPLVPGFVEVVEVGDPLAGDQNEHVDKIKIYGWRGPDFIDDAAIDLAGVGWILAENWWPYQRPSFVSPPFAGYVSGHSTFSRAAADVLTEFTGDAFFPGGVATFRAPKNKFLVFEEGPSVDVELQWATYRDASDQTSLSRIWGGIHPPVDDIPGRNIGITVAASAFAKADSYFNP